MESAIHAKDRRKPIPWKSECKDLEVEQNERIEKRVAKTSEHCGE
jgi:hypothetical protein